MEGDVRAVWLAAAAPHSQPPGSPSARLNASTKKSGQADVVPQSEHRSLLRRGRKNHLQFIGKLADHFGCNWLGDYNYNLDNRPGTGTDA